MAKNKLPKTMYAGRCYEITYANGDPTRAFFVVDIRDGGETWQILEQGNAQAIVEGMDELFPKEVDHSAAEIDPHQLGRHNVEDVAQWMWAEIQQKQELEQEVAAIHIRDHF